MSDRLVRGFITICSRVPAAAVGYTKFHRPGPLRSPRARGERGRRRGPHPPGGLIPAARGAHFRASLGFCCRKRSIPRVRGGPPHDHTPHNGLGLVPARGANSRVPGPSGPHLGPFARDVGWHPWHRIGSGSTLPAWGASHRVAGQLGAYPGFIPVRGGADVYVVGGSDAPDPSPRARAGGSGCS